MRSLWTERNSLYFFRRRSAHFREQIRQIPNHDSVPHSLHDVKIAPQIVNGSERGVEDFIRLKQVPEIGARIVPASMALATLVNRAAILFITSVFNDQLPAGCKKVAISRSEEHTSELQSRL